MSFFRDDFLAVVICRDGQFGDFRAFGDVAEQRKHLSQFALNFGPESGKYGVGIYFFSFAELENSVTQCLDVFFLFPVIEEEAGELVGYAAIVVGIIVFAQVFLCPAVVFDGSFEIAGGVPGGIDGGGIIELGNMIVNAAEVD